MIRQSVLTRIHKALGWAMLFLLPAQLLLGLRAAGGIGGRGSGPAGALHAGPWAALILGLMMISHGLLGIRFKVIKKIGGRAAAVLLALVWASFVMLLALFTV